MNLKTPSTKLRAFIHGLGAGLQEALQERRCAVCARPFAGPRPGHEADFTASGNSGPAPRPAPPQPYLCPECSALLPRREKGFCPLCGELSALESLECAPCSRCLGAPPPWGKITFHGAYQGHLRNHILKIKLGGALDLAEALGRLLAAHPDWFEYRKLIDTGNARPYSCIIPVPLHPSRLAERGFNQSAELARPLGRFLGLPLRQDLLERARPTPVQRGLDRKARRLNLRGAFAPNQRKAGQIKGLRVLLLDDVLTTGATLEEAAKTLLRAGAEAVDLAALARTPAHAPPAGAEAQR